MAQLRDNKVVMRMPQNKMVKKLLVSRSTTIKDISVLHNQSKKLIMESSKHEHVLELKSEMKVDNPKIHLCM